MDKHLLAIMATPEFCARLDADPVISALEAEKASPRDELTAFAQIIGGGYRVNRVAVRPLTAAIWCLWWCLGLGYARGKEPTETDTDVALWTLTRDIGSVGVSAAAVFSASQGFCRTKEIDWEDVAGALAVIIRDAFRPLEMLEPAGNVEAASAVEFDAGWMTRICASVTEVMHYPAHLIAVERPLAEVCYYYCWAAARNNPKLDVRRRTPAEICNRIWERTVRLAQEVANEQNNG